jgi:NADH-quinone oxidoreductase subunit M
MILSSIFQLAPLLGVPRLETPASEQQLPIILLSAVVWVPALGALVLLLFPERNERDRARIRNTAIAVTILVAFLALASWAQFSVFRTPFQFEENHSWIKTLGISYHLGVDGINLPPLLLSALLFMVVMLVSRVPAFRESDQFRGVGQQLHLKAYFALLLITETGVNGVFVALDYALFFLFWQLEVVPVFFLIAHWGGPRRAAAAWKFLLFNLAGSAFMLLAIALLYVKAGLGTFDMLALQQARLAPGLALLLFLLFLGTFLIRLPAGPLHSWLPHALTEASTPVAVLISGVLCTMGGYGLLRINLAGFPGPARQLSWLLAGLAVLGVAWGSLAALVQDDLKRMAAYSTLPAMAFVLLAASARTGIALNGSILQLLAHGLAVALLFLLVGAIQERTRTRSLRALGGLAERAPQLAVAGVLTALAAIGLPGLVTFIALFEIVLGSYPVQRAAVALCLLGLAMTAACLLGLLRRAFGGPTPEAFQRVRDLGAGELGYLVILLVPLIGLGLFPQLMVERIGSGVTDLVIRLGSGT